MKRKRFKIRIALFFSLVIIMGALCALYAAFCRGGSYNEVAVEPQTEAVTEEPVTEAPSDKAETPSQSVPDESESETESETQSPAAIGADYDPAEVLASENWQLALINSDYPLDKNYSANLSPVIEGSSVTADARVSEEYKKMYEAAKADGIILTPYAGYCSYSRQESNFQSKIQAFTLQGMSEEEAKAEALRRLEPAGCNESGSGLSVDIISASAGFSSTDEYKWLLNHAHEYGFILRYPENKTDITGIIFQPWHWRYVGTEAAKEMKESNLCLEEYLGARQ